MNKLLTEKEKNNKEYLKDRLNKAISYVFYERRELIKAYKYVHGILDNDMYKEFEEFYGTGSPCKIEFIPLIRLHIDELVGQFLRGNSKPLVTVKDNKTLDLILEEKRQKLLNTIYDDTKKTLEDSKKGKELSRLSENRLAELKEDLDTNFQSSYEKSVHFLLQHFYKSKTQFLKEKERQLFFHLVTYGYTYYRVLDRGDNIDPEVQVLHPADVFHRRTLNKTFINEEREVVYREYITREEIVNRYGHFMTKEDIKNLYNRDITNTTNYARLVELRPDIFNDTYMAANLGANINNSRNVYNSEYIEVYHVEWIDNNEIKVDGKKRYQLDLYRGIRIGKIYIDLGKVKNPPRSQSNPYDVKLSINGIGITDINGNPYSLALVTADLQDKYNLLHFMKFAIMSNSSIKSDVVDIAMIPTFLSEKDPMERLLEHMKLRKSGSFYIDSSQSGAANRLNTNYGRGMQTTGMDAEAIQAIQLAILDIENTVSNITGVFKQRLGGIEQREAVSNVQVGINQSNIITKQYYHLMDTLKSYMLTDLINIAKKVYKNGLKGEWILGNKKEIFNILPNHISMSDFDIEITNSSEENIKKQKLESLAFEMIKAGIISTENAVDIVLSDSITDIKDKLKSNDAMKQLAEKEQQIAQYEQELNKLSKENEKLLKQDNKLKQDRLDLDKQKLENDTKLKQEELDINKKFNEDKIKQMIDRNKLERAQILVGGAAAEVKNIE